MSWFSRFGRKPTKDSTPPPGALDPELLRRLEALAFANAKVSRGDLEADQVHLVPNTNREGVLEGERPSVGFRVEALGRQGDSWTFLARIDDATGYLRFLIDLHVEDVSPAARALDPENMPGFALTFRRHPEAEHGELLKPAFPDGLRDEERLAVMRCLGPHKSQER
jgi:hypothetical protein